MKAAVAGEPPGMVAAQAVLTSRGGKTSHSAVVARGMGNVCVCGAVELTADVPARHFTTLRVHRDVIEAPERKALLDAASTADLLVLGARRTNGRFGLQLGRVNHALLHHAPWPVAIVPQPA